MSDFWALWNKAEAGDTDAARQCNVLVYRQLIQSGGALIDGYHRVNAKIYPDYMHDLNAAAGLKHDPDDELSTIIRFIYRSHVVEVSIRRYHTDLVAMCESASEPRARVGAWWAVVTGEKQPETSE